MTRRWSRAEVAQRLFNTPLAVMRSKAEIAIGALGRGFDITQMIVDGSGDIVSISALEAKAGNERAKISSRPGDSRMVRTDWDGNVLPAYEVHDGIAVVEIRGSLMAEVGLDPASGATGYDGISYKVRRAVSDERVRGIMLDIDSPGGEVVDLPELTALLIDAAKQKPMRSIIRATGASAAYAIACCAPTVTTSPEVAIVGSIGALSMHVDMSRKLDKDGLTVTLVTSHPHKADGNPFEPLDAETAAFVQSAVDRCAQWFVAHVAAQRGLDISAINALEARCYSGEDAKAIGLVDKVMAWDQSMAEFADAVNGRQSAASPQRGGLSATANQGAVRMSEDTPAPAADQPGTTINASAEQLSAARSEGRAEGVTAERQRIAAIVAIDEGSRLSADASSAIEAGSEPGAFAVELAGKRKATGAAALAAAQADAVKPGQLPEGGGDPPGATTNRGAAAVARYAGKHPNIPASAGAA